jgi:hypothetical protein
VNRSRNRIIYISILGVLLVALLGGVTWGNYRYATENPGGNDFLVHWMGTRALIKNGISPYSDEAAIRIQTFAYGHPAEKGQHELRVAYPLYSVVLFTPFALIDDFIWARAVWMTALEAGLVGMVFLGMRLFRWKPTPLILGLLVLFSIFWYHGLRPLINGNAVILVTLGLVGGFLALRLGHDELAGVLLAFTTIKPQVVVLVLAYVVFWGLMNRRMRLVGWLMGTVLMLAVSSALIIPDWIVQNLREVMRYPSYNPPGNPGAAFAAYWPDFGNRLGWALTGITSLILMIEWWSNRHVALRGFLWVACLTLTASQWIGIQTDPGNFVVLFPALMMVFALLDERWKGRGNLIILAILLILMVGIWAIFLRTLQYLGQPIQSPSLFFPLPAVMFLLLYWVRWWAVRPSKLWIDQIGI